MKKIALLLAVLTMLSNTAVWADAGYDSGRKKMQGATDYSAPVATQAASTQSMSESYGSQDSYNMGDKFVRGLANILTSPLEIPRNVQNVTEENGVLVGWTGGICQGIGMMALRIVVGAYETVTFPIPLPADYVPVIQPEFAWDAPGPRVTPQAA